MLSPLPSRAPGVDLDCSRLRLRGFRNEEPQHTIRQVRLDPVGVELPRQRELALKVPDLVLLVDKAVPF
jgi:hypothetical protein